MAETSSTDRRRWWALTVCMAAGVMIFIDVSIVNVALPSLQQGLGASSAELSWVVAGYALTFGLLLVPGGRLGDARGRKRMFVAGLVAFAAASVLAGLAPAAWVLVVARLLQGAAGGALNPQILGLIQTMFSGRERGKAFGVFGAVNASSTAIGPLIGGLLIQLGGPDAGWRFVFLVNLPFGIAALLFARRLLPDDDPPEQRSHTSLDPLGALLLGLSVVAVMVPIVLSESSGPSRSPWWLLGPAAVLFAAFVGWERRFARRGATPLVTGRVLRRPGYALGTALGSLYIGGSTAIFFVLTVFFQRGLGYSPIESGLSTMPYAIGSAVAAAIGGRVVTRLGRPLVVAGSVVMLVGLGAAALLLSGDAGPHAGLVVAGPLLVAGLGSGMVITPNQTLTLADVPTDQGGTAAGMQQTAQRIMSSLGIAVVAAVFYATLAGTGEDYGTAIAVGLTVTLGLVSASFLLGVVDLLVRRRRRHREEAHPVQDHQGAPGPAPAVGKSR
ncbi:MFS transporter [Actinomycetospora sp. TBRC 11914]|nr:MFS transporter [Actinomycetospora sp. TBRC 11914]